MGGASSAFENLVVRQNLRVDTLFRDLAAHQYPVIEEVRQLYLVNTQGVKWSKRWEILKAVADRIGLRSPEKLQNRRVDAALRATFSSGSMADLKTVVQAANANRTVMKEEKEQAVTEAAALDDGICGSVLLLPSSLSSCCTALREQWVTSFREGAQEIERALSCRRPGDAFEIDLTLCELRERFVKGGCSDELREEVG